MAFFTAATVIIVIDDFVFCVNKSGSLLALLLLPGHFCCFLLGVNGVDAADAADAADTAAVGFRIDAGAGIGFADKRPVAMRMG